MQPLLQNLAGLGLAFGTAVGTLAIAADASKTLAVDLLQRGLVGGDRAFIETIVAKDYIQHNPQAPDGLEGLLGFVGYLQSLDQPIDINTVRVLSEGNLVMVHSEYTMDGKKAVFDLFRVDDGKLVEHWDAIQDVPASTASGRGMTDGPTNIVDIDKTAFNKALVTNFVTDVLVNGKGDKIGDYIGDVYQQHNPNVEDGLEGLGKIYRIPEHQQYLFRLPQST